MYDCMKMVKCHVVSCKLYIFLNTCFYSSECFLTFLQAHTFHRDDLKMKLATLYCVCCFSICGMTFLHAVLLVAIWLSGPFKAFDFIQYTVGYLTAFNCDQHPNTFCIHLALNLNELEFFFKFYS